MVNRYIVSVSIANMPAMFMMPVWTHNMNETGINISSTSHTGAVPAGRHVCGQRTNIIYGHESS